MTTPSPGSTDKPTGSTDKPTLRRLLRARRNATSARERRLAGQRLRRLALRHRLLARGRRAGFYIPTNGEIDVMPLMRYARAMGMDCFLPVVPGRGRRKLWFTQLGDKPTWVTNRYGIPEYHHAPARRLRARQLDLLFMPLLGFDAAGWRVGMGGGYYDASLAHLRFRRHWKKPRLIGVAFAAQEIERAPRDPWDVPLDGLLTERAYRKAKRQGETGQ